MTTYSTFRFTHTYFPPLGLLSVKLCVRMLVCESMLVISLLLSLDSRILQVHHEIPVFYATI